MSCESNNQTSLSLGCITQCRDGMVKIPEEECDNFQMFNNLT